MAIPLISALLVLFFFSSSFFFLVPFHLLFRVCVLLAFHTFSVSPFLSSPIPPLSSFLSFALLALPILSFSSPPSFPVAPSSSSLLPLPRPACAAHSHCPPNTSAINPVTLMVRLEASLPWVTKRDARTSRIPVGLLALSLSRCFDVSLFRSIALPLSRPLSLSRPVPCRFTAVPLSLSPCLASSVVCLVLSFPVYLSGVSFSCSRDGPPFLSISPLLLLL